MATITKRGQRWSVQIRRKGAPTLCKTFDTHADAKDWAAIEEARLAQGDAPLPMRLLRSTTVEEVLSRYLADVTPTKRSKETERLRLEKMKRDLIGELSLADLTSAHSGREAGHGSPRTFAAASRAGCCAEGVGYSPPDARYERGGTVTAVKMLLAEIW